MKKVTLPLDDLRVETFATAGAPAARGTVAAHAPSQRFTQCGAECLSYGGTCGVSPAIPRDHGMVVEDRSGFQCSERCCL